jgi:hypothetical protein
MDKFLSVPVSTETNMLLGVSGVAAIAPGDTSAADPTTKTTITFNAGNTATITHLAVVENAFRDSLQNAMTAALGTQWTRVVAAYTPPTAVSAIAIA